MTLWHIIFSLFLANSITAALTYCSSENTGTFQNSSLYMSNGLCHDKCLASNFALAIVQDEYCYCSNYLPSTTTDLSDCSLQCPGYPSEYCGSSSGLFGYIYLSKPAGTLLADLSSASTSPATSTTTPSSTTSTTTDSSTTSSSTTTTATILSITSSSTPNGIQVSSTISVTTLSSPSSSQATSMSTSSPITSTSSTTTASTQTTSSSITSTKVGSSNHPSSKSTSSSSAAESLASSDSSKSSSVSTPIITSIVYSVSTITQNEKTQFVTTAIGTTITLQPSSSSTLGSAAISKETGTSSLESKSSSGFWNSKGKVAGVFTVVGLLGLLLLSLLGWLIYKCCFVGGFARNEEDDDEDDEFVIPADGGITSPLPTNGFTRNSSGSSSPRGNNKMNFDMAVNEELSSLDETVINEKQTHTRTNSLTNVPTKLTSTNVQPTTKKSPITSTDFGTPIIGNRGESTYVDQRLDVGTFNYINEHDEVLSLNDNQDYSRRVFKVMNPDN